MRTMLMLAAAMAVGCADEHKDPHVMAPGDCGAKWVTDQGDTVVECEIGCAAGPLDPPLILNGKECPGSVEYDGQLGACWADPSSDFSKLTFRWVDWADVDHC